MVKTSRNNRMVLLAGTMVLIFVFLGNRIYSQTSPKNATTTSSPSESKWEVKWKGDPFGGLQPYLKELDEAGKTLADEKWTTTPKSIEQVGDILKQIEPIVKEYAQGAREGKYDFCYVEGRSLMDPGVFNAVQKFANIQVMKVKYHRATGKANEIAEDYIEGMLLCRCALSDGLNGLSCYYFSSQYLLSEILKEISAVKPLNRDDLKKILKGLQDFEPKGDEVARSFDCEIKILKGVILNSPEGEIRWANRAKKLDLSDRSKLADQYARSAEKTLEWLKKGYLATRKVDPPNVDAATLFADSTNAAPHVLSPFLAYVSLYYMTEYCVAASLFKGEEGKLPTNLEELDSKYFASKPLLDPFSGKAFCFKADSSGIKIWSVGPDMKDDGGKEMSKDRTGDLVVEFKPQ